MRPTVRVKLFLGFGVLIVALIGTGVFAATQLRTVGGKADQIFSQNLVAVDETGELRRDMLLMRQAILQYTLASTSQRPEVRASIASLEESIVEDIDQMLTLPGLTAGQLVLLDQIEQDNRDWFAARESGPIALTDAGDVEGAATAATAGLGNDAFNAAFEQIALFADETFTAAQQASDDAASVQQRAIILMIALILAAAVVGLGIALWISQGIVTGIKRMLAAAGGIATGDVDQDIEVQSNDEIGDMGRAFQNMIVYIKEMADSATLIADGDLTVNVQPRSDRDTLGNAFSRMVKSLLSLLGQVRTTTTAVTDSKDQLAQSADQSAQASQQVATTIGQVAEGASSQAQNATETNEGIAQLNRAIEEIASGSQVQARALGDVTALGDRVSEAAEQIAQNAQEAATGSRRTTEQPRQARPRSRRPWTASAGSRMAWITPPARSRSSASSPARSARSSR